MRRSITLLFSLAAVFALIVGTSATASAHARGTTYMKVKSAHGAKPRSSANLYYHGGAIQQSVRVVIIYWGTDWQTNSTYSSAISYIDGFFNGVGGSSWASSTTQYCQSVANGTVQCGSAGAHPTNPASSAVVVYDSTAVPSSPTQSQIAARAAAAANTFGNDANTNYMVFTPSGHSQSGFGTQWCAYHSSTGSVSYSYMPYQPDAGAACGQNFVNGGSAGNFDGFSIVGGHEYGETITDPYPSSGWLDSRGSENGDKCAWISSGQGAAADVKLGGANYAVQSLWSNAFNSGAGGCVLS